MSRLKVLPLESWMLNYARHEQGLPPRHECFRSGLDSSLPYMKDSYPREGVSPYPDGRYMRGCVCFFVVNGIAYKGEAGMFKYNLSILNSTEQLTRVDKIRQMYKLEVELYGKPTISTSLLILALEEREFVRTCQHGVLRMKLAIKKEKGNKV